MMVQRDMDDPKPRLEIDEAYREKLRSDPRVTVHKRTTTEPYHPRIILTEPVDVLWLLGRRDQEWVDDEGDLPRE